jgi:hypothetical protein
MKIIGEFVADGAAFHLEKEAQHGREVEFFSAGKIGFAVPDELFFLVGYVPDGLPKAGLNMCDMFHGVLLGMFSSRAPPHIFDDLSIPFSKKAK